MRSIFREVALLVAVLFLVSVKVSAERPQIKFGSVKPQDLERKVYTIDSGASAVVIADIGSCKYEGDSHGGFSIVYKRHLRVHLLNRNGFEAANVSIPLYIGTSIEDKLDKIEAVTFNLEGGKVVETKLDKNSIFKDKLSKYFNVRKFTMPNLKEGSIIDIQYTVTSPYETYMRPWTFQGAYPVLWSEYSTAIPSIFDFVMITQGYHRYTLNNPPTSAMETYSVLIPGSAGERSEVVNVSSLTLYKTWAMEDVPALKPESFTSSINNHISQIDFQLARLKYPNSNVREVMTSWPEAAKNLLKDPDFGEELTKGFGWLKDDLKTVTQGATSQLESARKIYQYVRDNFTCTSHSAKYKSAPLRKVLQSKSGNVADINLLLTAMFMAQGLDAHPVLLSTREHGKAYEIYPVMDKFNYVITQVVIDNISYLLDASYNKLGFGKLNSDCYNGYARIISESPLLLNLLPDSLRETKVTSLFLFEDEKGGLNGTFQSVLGQDESFGLRESVAKSGKDEYFKSLKSGFTTDIAMANANMDSLTQLDEPVTIYYNFHLDAEEDIIYFDPMMSEAIKKNPFTAAKRFYPVEMPHSFEDIFTLRMDIPKGYKIDEMPKSTRVNYNEDEGMFEYLISVSGNVLQMRSKVKMNKATFMPEDYESLRDFFAFIVKKQSEQIVFKKIK